MATQPTQPKGPKPSQWAALSPQARIALALLALIVIAYVAYAVAWNKSNDSDTTTPSGLDKTSCMAFYNARIGHDPNDNAFWHDLVECANNGLLPAGQNNPGYYAP